jgi:glutathione synthase
MTIKLGVVMDAISSIPYKKDSTLAMLWEADNRNWDIRYIEQQDMFIENGQAMTTSRSLKPFKDPECWYQLGDANVHPLAECDVIFMRKDPPFDMEFIYSTYILDKAEKAGSLIVNKPQSLRDCNEKIFATEFPDCCTPTTVSANAQILKKFAEKYNDIILKPLDGMGGASIFRTGAKDKNLSVIIETLTGHGKTPAMAQQFIPDISQGDKRILIIDGEPVPFGLSRIPAKGENRGNLAAGGTGVVNELSDRERWICEQIRDTLVEKGLIFVGLDVIGDYVTEINVTSPTCIREIEAATSINIAGLLMDAIERRLAKK